jgi:DNA-binding response OmpR family regulator
METVTAVATASASTTEITLPVPSGSLRLVADKQLGLTQKGVLLLEYLVRHEGEVFTRNQLLDAVWGAEVAVEERTVDVAVRRLRTFLINCGSTGEIRTARTVGYYFITPGSPLPVEFCFQNGAGKKIELHPDGRVSCDGIVAGTLIHARRQMLKLFCENFGKTLTRGKVMHLIYPTFEKNNRSRTVDVYVYHLRPFLNLCGYDIETIRGEGYRCIFAPSAK